MSVLVMIAAMGLLASSFTMVLADDYGRATFMVSLAVFVVCVGIYHEVAS